MTPETPVVVAYLLTFVMGGVPPGTPFSIVNIPALPSLDECDYLAHQIIGTEQPKYKCTRYQMVVGAAPSDSAATWRLDPKDADNASPELNCEAEGIRYHCQVPRPEEAWIEDSKDEDNASPVPPVGLHDHDPEACAAGASECPPPPRPHAWVQLYHTKDGSFTDNSASWSHLQDCQAQLPSRSELGNGEYFTCEPMTEPLVPNRVRPPRTKIEYEFGTIFGSMPRDGRAGPLNELIIAGRSTFFRLFVWPNAFRHL
jgi:hypothetical protein